MHAARPSRISWLGRLSAGVALAAAALAFPAETRAAAGLAANLEGYFADSDPASRQAYVAAIERDKAFRPEKLSAQLQDLPLWPKLTPNRRFDLEVEVGAGEKRTIAFHIPRGYKPDKAWPLILALRPSGGSAHSMLSYVQSLLGSEVDRYVLAAPHDFGQTRLDAGPPFVPEYPAMVRAIRQQVHVDADRVFAVGYSFGGHATWTLSLLHTDLLAGAMPIASTISIPGDFQAAWARLLPNLAGLPLVHVWGEEDPLDRPGLEGRQPKVGSMASLNRDLAALVDKLDLPALRQNRLPGVGHDNADPRPGELAKLLKNKRERWPKQVRHHFRHLHQGSAYWLEALAWQGEGWFDYQRPLERAAGETWPQAYERVFLPLLGELRGEVTGRKIQIETRHVADLVVWLSPELLDLGQPIEIELNGKPVFAGKVAPSLGVALAQADRTRDFERLRWAGIRIDADGKASIVDAATAFPPLIPEP